MTAVDLVDIGGGNIGSISRCLQRLHVEYRLADAGNPPDGARPLVVPGVGNFGAVMDSLRGGQLDAALTKLVKRGTPYLGICVGMQVLFDESEESPGNKGLGLVPGKVMRFQHGKVPQIGWNKIRPRQAGWPEGYVYFVNSYYPQPESPDVTAYDADYGTAFCAAVCVDNITAFQFHPEKSGPFGATLIQRWLSNVC
jgi:glutamine amidotransferase